MDTEHTNSAAISSQHEAVIWDPIIGEEISRLRKRLSETVSLPEEETTRVVDAARSILAKGIKPQSDTEAEKTGLVIGYVQSGKTLSYITAMALAKDNHYGMIIVATGISTWLLDQTTKRIRKELSIDDQCNHSRWLVRKNMSDNNRNQRLLQQVIRKWHEARSDNKSHKAILITVMKNHVHLGNLLSLLDQLDMARFPVLIIDDEADQASLNTHARQEDSQSTIYRHITELRKAIPYHTYLQYTATPQAPLLISIADSLSPDFVELLDPGENYVGGKTFFGSFSSKFVCRIDDDDLGDDDTFGAPPQSLLEAMRIFFIGVAAGTLTCSSGNRSMLIHPSHRTALHEEYRAWIEQIIDHWCDTLQLPEKDPDKTDLLQAFRSSHIDLSTTETSLPGFEEIKSSLLDVCSEVTVRVVNSTVTEEPSTIEWSDSYGWILIGGQALERGFTVEGLTVTYMPRKKGVGNVDAIQQRGRFFGYKRSYLGYCRIFLSPEIIDAYKSYVEHEEEIRDQLEMFAQDGRSLKLWQRAFLLEPDFQLCRKSVISNDYVRSLGNIWYAQHSYPESKVLEDNSALSTSFLSSLSQDGKDEWKNQLYKPVKLQDVFEQLILPYTFSSGNDSTRFSGIRILLSKALDNNPEELANIYKMRFTRTRKFNNGIINNLFQGRDDGTKYPGDHAIKNENYVSIQIHSVIPRDGGIAAPFLAIWIPKHMGFNLVTQEQTDI